MASNHELQPDYREEVVGANRAPERPISRCAAPLIPPTGDRAALSQALPWAGILLALGLLPANALAEQRPALEVILSSRETAFFVVTILGLTIWFTLIRYTRFSVTHGPEILTTAGIMGCFFGIAVALLQFDAHNIQQSVPILLEGVKTAFWSSLAGVTGALIIRARHYFSKPPAPTDPAAVKVASLDDVVSSMIALRKGLVGDEQGTLLSQIKLQRQESKDKSDELIREFRHFAAHMVENNQKAIVEALRQVIADFNQKLTEQFGENFKNLNQAVEKLVVWQQQYKEELDQIKAAQRQAATDMGVASERFGEFVNKAERFAAISEALRRQLELLETHSQTLFEQERALAEVLVTMRDVTPTFVQKVDAMLGDLNAGVGKLQSDLSGLMKNLGTQVQASNAELKGLLVDVLRASQKELGTSLAEHSRILKEGVLALDKALQKELNDSLSTLGQQLASLSNKFVQDYSPLTDRLREVVQMSRRV